jgi:hypothetical protein
VEAEFDLPTEVRNQLSQIVIDGQNSAGAVVLMDEQWRQRPVGLLQDHKSEAGDPLLEENFYISQALAPYVDLREGQVDEMLQQQLAVMVMGDGVDLSDQQIFDLDKWVRSGGTLLRFSGPQLATDPDSLLPVKIREGRRDLSGTMSWGAPQKIRDFDKDSPFYGIELPDNIQIYQQVLAQPGSAGLGQKIWAELDDGTPLITAENRGDGMIVLVHTTADPRWSNLALSGAFIDMLRTVVSHSQGIVSGSDVNGSFDPFQSLDSKGQLGLPAEGAKALVPDIISSHVVSQEYPPGYYGSYDSRKAYNLGPGISEFEAIGDYGAGTSVKSFNESSERKLAPSLLTAAMLIFLLDGLVVLGQKGLLPGTGSRRGGRKPADPVQKQEAPSVS